MQDMVFTQWGAAGPEKQTMRTIGDPLNWPLIGSFVLTTPDWLWNNMAG